MHGHVNPQAMLFSYVSPKTRVSATHSLRRIKAVADQVLRKLAPTFAVMYSAVGRPSIPPERLLKRGGDRVVFGAKPSVVVRTSGHRLYVNL